MYRPRVIPALLLQDGRLVKTVRFKQPMYVGDPINTVRIFNEKEVDEILVLDIGATPTGATPPYAAIEELASECFMPLGYGGGITSLEQIRTIFRLGVEKVVLNSALFTHPGLLAEAAATFGSQSIVAAIDVKRGLLGGYGVRTHGGRVAHKLDPVAHARALEAAGAGEILLTAIDRDGTRQGYDLALTRAVAAAVSIPVVACGGAGELADFGRALEAGAAAVAAGSFFVLHGKHRAVLVTYPAPGELDALFAAQDGLPA